MLLQIRYPTTNRSALPAREGVASRRVGTIAHAQEPSRTSVPEAMSHADAPSTSSRAIYELSEVAAAAPAPTSSSGPLPPGMLTPLAAAAGLGIAAYGINQAFFNKGSRAYDGNVGSEYDAWTEEGILEYYVSGLERIATYRLSG
jgi:MPBQ/MSBQ methyltransferase